MTSSTPESIADYYDRNTGRFLRFGGSRNTAAIHRRIWAPGVASDEEAFLYLNRLVAETIRGSLPASRPDAQAIDLGCGVGGTATWVAEELGIQVTGVANSPVQVEIARRRAAQRSLQDRCRFLQADFLSLPPLGRFQAAWAIESFVHAVDPQRFFEQTSALLEPGGLLVICDDFLAQPGEALQQGEEASTWIRRFQHGWRVPNLLTANGAAELAEAQGFASFSSLDLTPWLRTRPGLILQLIALITRLPLRSPYWQNLAGGSALQVCIRNGWTRYQALVLKKV